MNEYKIFENSTVIKVEGLDLYFDNGKVLSVHEFETYISDHEVLGEKDYEHKARQFIGKTIRNSFCNGFFDDSKQYNLAHSEITRIYENDDEIVIEVEKGSECDYGRFDGGWKCWKTVYEHLQEWT